MASISDITAGYPVIEMIGDPGRDIKSLCLDSRKAVAGSMFFALTGTVTDGHEYMGTAIANGAAAIVCRILPVTLAEGVAYIRVADTDDALGHFASSFHGHPSRALKLCGITGTNGKTTTATLLSDLFTKLGYKTGLISTVEYRIAGNRYDSTHTTPDAIRLNRMLAEMVAAGCDYCFMEVSSHSTVQKRVNGLQFAGGVFTNLTHDHLDYHGSFAEYIKAKKAFFDSLPRGAFALVNRDDRNGMVMTQNTKAGINTYSLHSPADFHCRILETHLDGMLLNINGGEVWVGFLGRFNAYNLTAVYGTALLLGADKTEVLTAVSLLRPVSGRFEYVRSAGGITAIVDYAHTPDALVNVLDTIGEIIQPGQKVITIVGCGGNRDAAKRPVMAGIATEKSDVTILTSDNPRFEKPEEIIEDMKKGVTPGRKCIAITDRREAIRTAAMLAGPEDMILIAGKGHETYQEICGKRSHFDDKETITAIFGEL